MVNLPQILNSKPVTVTIPSFLSHKEPPIVSYSYINTIGSKNFKQCMKNLDFDVGTNDMSCNCGNSIYMDKGIGHVLTGNLSIIKDRELRKLIEKGPSYREQNNINWNTNLKNFVCAIKRYKMEWARREKVDARVLSEWEATVTCIVKDRIDKVKNKHKVSFRQYRKQVLTKYDKAHLNTLPVSFL